MPRVLIVQRVLPHYRVPFFSSLQERLAEAGIAFELVYGQERPGTVPRTVDIEAPWARKIDNRYILLGATELIWQPCLQSLRGVDLVIVEQASRLLLNYLLIARRKLARQTRVAYWGHGRNFQSEAPDGFIERVKRRLADQVDWWFAYTALSARTAVAAGVRPDRITVVDNAIDTSALAAAWHRIKPDELASLRASLGISPNAPVAVYCGGMHAGKELPFLLECCRAIHARVPELHVLFIGSGPDEHHVITAAAEQPWIHFVGPVYGPERAALLALAQLMLLPAHVGLVAIDSFVTATPIFTTDHPSHGPEVEYLHPGENCVLTHFEVNAYAEAVARYLRDPAALARLKESCLASAARYTLDNMVDRFVEGIAACLGRTATA